MTENLTSRTMSTSLKSRGNKTSYISGRMITIYVVSFNLSPLNVNKHESIVVSSFLLYSDRIFVPGDCTVLIYKKSVLN